MMRPITQNETLLLYGIVLLCFFVTLIMLLMLQFKEKKKTQAQLYTIQTQTLLRDIIFNPPDFTFSDTTNQPLHHHFTGTIYLVIIITYTQLQPPTKQTDILEHIPSGFRVFSVPPINRQQTTLFVGQSNAPIDILYHHLTMHSQNEDAFYPHYFIGVGTPQMHIRDVHQSYLDACDAHNYLQLTKKQTSISFYHQIPTANTAYYLPEHEAARLSNLIQGGDVAGAVHHMNNLCDVNFSNEHLSLGMMQIFIMHLSLSVFKQSIMDMLKSCFHENIGESLHKSLRLAPFEQYQQTLSFIQNVTETIHFQKQARFPNIILDIKHICDTQYHNPELNLSGLADQFNKSETYLSLQFKHTIGVNFYTYLQNIRINKAMSELKNTQTSIHEISVRAGYTSYNSFAKAFKRHTGINAKAYRESFNG